MKPRKTLNDPSGRPRRSLDSHDFCFLRSCSGIPASRLSERQTSPGRHITEAPMSSRIPDSLRELLPNRPVGGRFRPRVQLFR